MTSAKAVLGAIAGRFLFRISTVARVEHLGRFVRLEAAGTSLRGAPWRTGDKVQVFRPGVGMRTYTPLEVIVPRDKFRSRLITAFADYACEEFARIAREEEGV